MFKKADDLVLRDVPYKCVVFLWTKLLFSSWKVAKIEVQLTGERRRSSLRRKEIVKIKSQIELTTVIESW